MDDDNDYVTEIELHARVLQTLTTAPSARGLSDLSAAAMKNSIVEAVVRAAATAACGAITVVLAQLSRKTIVEVSVGPNHDDVRAGKLLTIKDLLQTRLYCKGNDVERTRLRVEDRRRRRD
ncbi:hypothetical protein GPJ56_002617 [Histomonas meleagridis]|nr:hypothetical protein GPJ56_002617 [Histomonas meleagridis]